MRIAKIRIGAEHPSHSQALLRSTQAICGSGRQASWRLTTWQGPFEMPRNVSENNRVNS